MLHHHKKKKKKFHLVPVVTNQSQYPTQNVLSNQQQGFTMSLQSSGQKIPPFPALLRNRSDSAATRKVVGGIEINTPTTPNITLNYNQPRPEFPQELPNLTISPSPVVPGLNGYEYLPRPILTASQSVDGGQRFFLRNENIVGGVTENHPIYQFHPSDEITNIGGTYQFYPYYGAWLNANSIGSLNFGSGFSIHKIGSIQKQLEYYFSEENLSKDSYIYKVMDLQGYVPASEFVNWARMKKLDANELVIIEAASQSPFIEVNGNKLRKRFQWEKFLPDSHTYLIDNGNSNETEPFLSNTSKENIGKSNQTDKKDNLSSDEVNKEVISKIVAELETKCTMKKKDENNKENQNTEKENIQPIENHF